ncbi:MAG: hypothetical protein Q9227_006441 [Pyrenula ochraceoflavens]
MHANEEQRIWLKYQAALEDDISRNQRITGEYLVILQQGHSIQLLSERIRADITVHFYFDVPNLSTGPAFAVRGISSSLLSLIQSDGGVGSVTSLGEADILDGYQESSIKFLTTFSLFGATLPSITTINSPKLPAPFHQPENFTLVPDEYIVKLRVGHTFDAHFFRIGLNLSETAQAFHAIKPLNAYHVRLDQKIIHELVRADPDVKYVEHDSVIEVPASIGAKEERETHFVDRNELSPRWTVGQSPARWWWELMLNAGNRIDLTREGGPGRALMNGGRGVNVYVLDTGGRISHSLFRLYGGDAAVNFSHKYIDDSLDDANGHGTHVAGIIKQIAPGVRIVNVKITSPESRLFPPGSNANTYGRLVRAVVDIVQEHLNNRANRPYPYWKGSVISYALAAPNSPIVENAFKVAYEAGIPIVAAAGNYGERAFSPARPTVDKCYSDVITGLRPGTINRLAITGLGNPNKDAGVPYKGAPAVEVDDQNKPPPDPIEVSGFMTVVAATDLPSMSLGSSSTASAFEGSLSSLVMANP